MKNKEIKPKTLECHVEKMFNIIGGKWSFLIVKNLFAGTKTLWRASNELTWNQPQDFNRMPAFFRIPWYFNKRSHPHHTA